MRLQGVKVGFALTGSHCTLEKVLPELRRLVAEGAEVYPIVSPAVEGTDTRYGRAAQWLEEITAITGRRPITTITEAEPIGPKKLLDVLIIAPCTGNTLAKLANGITDTPVLMAAKAQLRNQRPVVLAISTNDALSTNAKNLGLVLNMKNVYLVPFGQDDPEQKWASVVAKMELLLDTTLAALKGKQIQPILVGS
ncbi:MAG: dipicolinate synthase subunit B [Moorellales bacterium]